MQSLTPPHVWEKHLDKPVHVYDARCGCMKDVPLRELTRNETPESAEARSPSKKRRKLLRKPKGAPPLAGGGGTATGPPKDGGQGKPAVEETGPKAKAKPKPKAKAPPTSAGAARKDNQPSASVGSPPTQPKLALRQADWTGELVGYEELADYKGKGPILVHAVDEAQAMAADILASQVVPTVSRAVVWEDKDGTIQVPFHVQGRVVLRRVKAIEYKHDVQPLPSLRNLTEKTKKVSAKTAVLRIVAVKTLMQQQDFTEVRANAKRYLQRKFNLLKDVWGMAEEKRYGDAVVGLVRVDMGQVGLLMKGSGTDGVFFEPTADIKKPVQVQWLQKAEDEGDRDYLLRALKQRPELGVTIGRSQLGLRSSVEPSKAMRTWRLQRTPVYWTDDLVLEILAEQTTMKNAEVRSKITRNHKATWIIRGASEDDFAQVRVDEEGKVQSYWVTPASGGQRRGPGQRTVLRQGAMNFARDQFGKHLATGDVQVQQPDAAMTGDTQQAEGTPSKKQAVEQRKLPEGTTLDTVPGDGACLVSSLAKGIAYQKPGKLAIPGTRLRAEIVAHMCRDKHKARFAAFWDGLAPDGKTKLANFDQYLDQVRQPKSWMGHLELIAAADVFGLTIYVVPRNPGHIPCKFGVGPFPVALWYTGEHYDYIKPDDHYPIAITNIGAEGSSKGGRGGGDIKAADSDAVSTRSLGQSSLLTLWTRDSRGHPKVRAKTPLKAPGTQAAQSEACEHAEGRPSSGSAINTEEEQNNLMSARAGDTQLSGDEESPRSMPSTPEPLMPEAPPPRIGSRGRLLKPKREKRKEWQCRWCDFKTSGASMRSMRYNHLLKWHPERRAEWDERSLPPQHAWKDVCDEGNFLWKCKHCNRGIVDDGVERDKNALYRARVAHWKEAHPQAPRKDFLADPGEKKTGVKKATRSVIAAAASRMVLRVKSGEAGKHKVEAVRIPVPATRSPGKRKSQVLLFCTSCTATAPTVKKLAEIECVPGSASRGSPRDGFIARLQGYLDEDHAEELLIGVRRLLKVLKPSVGADAGVKRPNEQSKVHEWDALAWPQHSRGTCSFQVRIVCRACRLSGSTKPELQRKPCVPGRSWSTHVAKHVQSMRRFVAEGPPEAVEPAKRVLKWLQASCEVARAEVEVPAGLAPVEEGVPSS